MEIMLPIVLIVGGLLLIALEAYVMPGVGVAGIGGLIALIFAVGIAYAEGGWAGGVLALLGATVALILFALILRQTGGLDNLVRAEGLQLEKDKAKERKKDRARFLGKRGTTVTSLRPSGAVLVDGERIEVQTEGEYISPESEVRIVAMDRRRYFVRLAEEEES